MQLRLTLLKPIDENKRKADYKAKSNEWLAYFDQNPDASVADLQAAAESYAGDPEGVPEWLRKRIRYQDQQVQPKVILLLKWLIRRESWHFDQ